MVSPLAMTATGGDGGASGGEPENPARLTGPRPPPLNANSTPQTASLTTSRLFSLFEECVEHGIWARLETFKQRGVACVDFSCRLRTVCNPTDESELPRARKPRSKRGRERNVARTKTWKQTRRQSRHSPPTQAAPPATTAVNVPALGSSSSPARRSFAEVAAQPATSAAPNAVKAAEMATAGRRGAKATLAHPKKVAKVALAASRVSQRAAVLAKKRAVAETPTATASPSPFTSDNEEVAPEILRGIEGETGLNSTAEISLVASPQSPPLPQSPQSPPSPQSSQSPPSPQSSQSSQSPTSPPSPPPTQSSSPVSSATNRKKCNGVDCTVECEVDYYDERIVDGRRLNTQKPDWCAVFPLRKGLCRFCEKSLPGLDDENCSKCFKKTILQLVLKYGPRWCYERV